MALLFAGLFVPVIAMYFIRQRRDAVVLPSLVLWARVIRDRSQAARLQRFRNNPLLWLQLALMAALVLSLARPFQPGARAPGQVTVIVLDASASMQTREANGRTRFDQAKIEVAAAVRALGGGDRMMLVAAGPRPWVVQGLTDDTRAFQRALRELRCTDGVGDLHTALRVATQAAGPGTPPAVQVWTDGAGRALANVADLSVPVLWHAVGETAENVATTALAVRRRPDSPLDLEVFGAVTNVGAEAQTVAVSLTLDGTLLSYTRRAIPASGTAVLTEPLLAGRSGVVQLRVDADDALPVDDTATLVLAAQRTVRVLLVTRGNAVLERVLRLLPGVEVFVAAPGNVRIDRVDVDLAVLDRWVPPHWPLVPALVFGPPPVGDLARAHRVEAPAVAGWRRDHPLLRHLTFADVHVTGALLHPGGAGVTSLVSGAEGGLIWSQRVGGAEQIIVGFPLDASDWILRPSFPLFLVNVVERVRGAAEGSEGSAVGVGTSVHARLPPGLTEATVTYPDGHTATLTPRGRIVTVDDTWQAGVYQFAGAGWSAARAVNLLDTEESRIRAHPLPEGATAEARRAGFGVTREYWPWLLLLALVISTVEWAVFHRRAD